MMEHVKFEQFIDTIPRMVCVCSTHSIYVHHQEGEHGNLEEDPRLGEL